MLNIPDAFERKTASYTKRPWLFRVPQTHDETSEIMRAGRMLAQRDLALIALSLIVERPRHGYEIIKLVADKTAGWYSPSPGMVYPTLTYLKKAGYVTAEAEGTKKVYTITDEGRAKFEENRDFLDAVAQRLSAISKRVLRCRFDGNVDNCRASPIPPPLVVAAIDNLHEVAAKRLEEDAEAESKLVEVLARAASELKRV
jgi:DNA-binding PadR family transcriptional regulator